MAAIAVVLPDMEVNVELAYIKADQVCSWATAAHAQPASPPSLVALGRKGKQRLALAAGRATPCPKPRCSR